MNVWKPQALYVFTLYIVYNYLAFSLCMAKCMTVLLAGSDSDGINGDSLAASIENLHKVS